MALILLLSLFVALVFAGFLIILTTPELLTSWESFFSHMGATIALTWNTITYAYVQLFEGAVVNFHDLRVLIDNPSMANLATVLNPLFGPSGTVTYATPLIVAGLGLAIGFQSGLFDIGGQGQVIGGGALCLIVAISVHLPAILLVPLEIIAAMAGGALLAAFAGVLKAYTGAHEVITTMMTSRIIGFLLPWFLTLTFIARPGFADGASKAIPPAGQLPFLLSGIGSNLQLSLGFVFAVASVFAVQWFFNRSKLGFQLKMVGQSPEAARTAGINSKRAIVVSLSLAGAMLGFAGMIELTGIDHFMSPNFGGSYGIDAIAVALIGRNKPWGVFAAALFFGAMQSGGLAMQSATQLQPSLALVIQAVVAFCVATPFLVVDIFKLKNGERYATSTAAGGWA